MAEYESSHKHYEKELADWRKGKGNGSEPMPPEKPIATRYLVSDATIEALIRVLKDNPRGVLSASDELSGWFGSFDKYRGGKASSDAANWLSMFNAGFVQSDRVTTGTQFVSQAAMSIVGGIQPGILRRVLSDEHRESGLAARMLLVCPPRRPKKRTESDIPESVEQRMEATFEGLLQLLPAGLDETEVDPVLATLTPEAKSLFVGFVNDHGREASELSGDLSAAWSKLEAYTARFALVFHYIRLVDGDLPVDADDDVVDADTMRSALAVVDWLKHETRRVYAMFGETDDRRELRELAEWIGTRGGELSQTDVQRGRRELKTSADTETAINKLVEAGFDRWFTNPPSKLGGRATRGFRLESVHASTLPPRNPGDSGGRGDVDSVDKRETSFDDCSDGSDRGAA